MLTSELISAIAHAKPELMQKDAERVVSTIFEEIANVLAQGGRVGLSYEGSGHSR
jgi:integration host factor subunit beta